MKSDEKKFKEMEENWGASETFFRYGAYHFAPYGKLREGTELSEIILTNRTELRLWDDYFSEAYREIPTTKYSHKGFYQASRDSDKDIFMCLENWKLYLPCEHELMEFGGYRGKNGKMEEKVHSS